MTNIPFSIRGFSVGVCFLLMSALKLGAAEPEVGVSKVDESLGAERWNCGFVVAAKMPGAVVAHTGTVLADGKVLVTGGYGKLFGLLPVASTMGRIYDSEKNNWRVLKGSLKQGRLGHAAVRLGDGRVVIVGGHGQENKALGSVEIFDPTTETFEVVGNLSTSCDQPRLNLLGDSRVLVTGLKKQPEIIEGAPNEPKGFTIRKTKGQTRHRHSEHAAITLADGGVLLVGGRTSVLEKFDPGSESFSVCEGRLPGVYDDQCAILLFNGKVLIAGGQEIYSNRCVSQSWIYDPAADALSDGPVFVPRELGDDKESGVSDMVAVDLFENRPGMRGRYFLFCGGEFDPGKGKKNRDVVLKDAWVYSAPDNRLDYVGPMLKGHDEFAATILPAEGETVRVLITAGYGSGDSFQNDCEIFSCEIPESIRSLR